MMHEIAGRLPSPAVLPGLLPFVPHATHAGFGSIWPPEAAAKRTPSCPACQPGPPFRQARRAWLERHTALVAVPARGLGLAPTISSHNVSISSPSMAGN